MSIFSGIKKAFKKVFRGVKKTFKKIWKSPLGKILLIAAAVWTGGAALAAMGTGSGFAGFGSALIGGTATGAGGSIGALGALKGAVGLGAAGGKFGLAGVKAAAGATGGLGGAIAPASSYIGLGGAAAPTTATSVGTVSSAATAGVGAPATGFLGKAIGAAKGIGGSFAKNPLGVGNRRARNRLDARREGRARALRKRIANEGRAAIHGLARIQSRNRDVRPEKGGLMRAPMGQPPLAGAVAHEQPGMGMEPGMGPQAPGPEEMEPGQEAATPEEQQIYDQALVSIVNAMSSEDGSAGAFKMIENTGNPVESIGDVATMLVENEDDNQGGALPDEVLAPLTMEVAERLATLANSKGIVQVDQAMLQEIGRYALAKLGDDYGNTPEDMVEAIGPELQGAGLNIPPEMMGGGGMPPGGGMPQGGPPQGAM